MSCCEIYLLVFTHLGLALARTLLHPQIYQAGLARRGRRRRRIAERERGGATAKRAPRARADRHCSYRVMLCIAACRISLVLLVVILIRAVRSL